MSLWNAYCTAPCKTFMTQWRPPGRTHQKPTKKLMNYRFKRLLPLAAVATAALIAVLFFYGKVLISPDNYLYSTSGDGIKNYYTFAWHIRHDTSFTHFSGMNYPYGEHYLYTDCHPLVANAMRSFATIWPQVASHPAGLLNLMMILSIAVTPLVLFKILTHLKLPDWMAVVFSITIATLSPQVFRLTGHLALSYSLAIPITWLLLIRAHKKQHGVYSALLFANGLFWMLIHAYLGMIALLFAIVWLTTAFLADNNRRRLLLSYSTTALSLLLPIVLFFLYARLTDSHTGRTDNPSGFFLYNAEPDDLLVPPGKPLRPLLDSLTGGAIRQQWEALGYIGFGNAMLLVVITLMTPAALLNRKVRRTLQNLFDNRQLNISLVAASVVLLFAMGIPFKQFPQLADIFPVVKQFRATGRFVWPFYFVFATAGSYILWKIWQNSQSQHGKKAVAATLIAVLVVFHLIEGYHYHRGVAASITSEANLFDTSQLPDNLKRTLNQIKPESYQAIVPLPYFYQGSEVFARPRCDASVTNSLIASWHLGLPLMSANLTRTSIEESKRLVQLVTPNYYPKPISHDLPDTKPLLLLVTGTSLTPYEASLAARGEKLFKSGDTEWLSITPEALFADESPSVISKFNNRRNTLVADQGFLASEHGAVIWYDDFEQHPCDTAFRGKGSYGAMKRGKHTLASLPPGTFKAGEEYKLSVWMYNGEPDALNLWLRLVVEEYDARANTWHTTTFFPEQAETLAGDWSLAEGTFKIQNPVNQVYIATIGHADAKPRLHADDLLIQRVNTDVYRTDSSNHYLFFNNHKVKIDDR